MSNFASIQVDLPDSQNPQYCQNFPIVAEIVKIVKVEQGYTIVALRDFSGVENTALIRGRVKPTYPEIGQIKVFNLAGKTKDGRIGYSGFYNPQDPIPPELAGKRPPAPVQGQMQATGGSGARGGVAKGNYSDAGKNRGVALSYAKDLAVAGKIDLSKIISCAVTFADFIENGIKVAPNAAQPVQQPVQQAVQQAPIEREVAEIGFPAFDGVGTGPQESYPNDNQDPYGKSVVQGAAIVQGAGQGAVVIEDIAKPAVPYRDEDMPF